MAPAGSQQLLAQDPAPARRCVTEGRTGHQGLEGGNGHGNRHGGGDGNEDEYGNEHECRDRSENGSGNGDENRDVGRGEKKPVNLRSGNRGNRSWSEHARVGATPTSKQQPQPQDLTPQ